MIFPCKLPLEPRKLLFQIFFYNFSSSHKHSLHFIFKPQSITLQQNIYTQKIWCNQVLNYLNICVDNLGGFCSYWHLSIYKNLFYTSSLSLVSKILLQTYLWQFFLINKMSAHRRLCQLIFQTKLKSWRINNIFPFSEHNNLWKDTFIWYDWIHESFDILRTKA